MRRAFYLKGPEGRPWVFHQLFNGTYVGDAPGLRTIIRRYGDGWMFHVRRMANGTALHGRERYAEADTFGEAVRRSQESGHFLLPPRSQYAQILEKQADWDAELRARTRAAAAADSERNLNGFIRGSLVTPAKSLMSETR